MSTRVLVVDDSALIREILTRTLVRDGDIEIAGVAGDAHGARAMIKALDPDVLTLDIEMPDMNGLDFLGRLMRLHPLPVVMVSSLTTRGAAETLLALELGAVDFVAKPSVDRPGGLDAWGVALRDKVRAAAASAVRNRPQLAIPPAPLRTAAGPPGAVIAIGASTGGVEAIRLVLSQMPADCPPVVIAQHMPAGFTARFAARLDEFSALTVREAADGMPLEAGHGYLAPGNWHLRLGRVEGTLCCRLGQEEGPVSGHRPSVDVLFESMARNVGPLAVGVILTGMGRDGAGGLRAIREAGGYTLGQSQGSALVYGMPRVAFEEGAVIEQVPLEAVAGRIAAALDRIKAAAEDKTLVMPPR